MKLPEFLHIINTKETVAVCVHPIGVDVVRRDWRKDVNIKLWPDLEYQTQSFWLETVPQRRIRLKGAAAKAKANASQAVPELVRFATGKRHSENRKKKHDMDAKYGWYRYDVRFAIPVYSDQTGMIARYNIYKAVMLVRHAEDDHKYLYDFVELKKETSSPPRSEDRTV